ncbi:MAG: PTS lactose/cellobiose transporter subunit IIA, partial [Anaeroglobus sp.]
MIVVGIRFKPAGKVYYFDPAGIDLDIQDGVIVETARGTEFGTVVIEPREVEESEVVQPLKPIVRRATTKDLQQASKNKEREKRAFGICLEKIELSLLMVHAQDHLMTSLTFIDLA